MSFSILFENIIKSSDVHYIEPHVQNQCQSIVTLHGSPIGCVSISISFQDSGMGINDLNYITNTGSVPYITKQSPIRNAYEGTSPTLHGCRQAGNLSRLVDLHDTDAVRQAHCASMDLFSPYTTVCAVTFLHSCSEDVYILKTIRFRSYLLSIRTLFIRPAYVSYRRFASILTGWRVAAAPSTPG